MIRLTPPDIAALTSLRRALHQSPEVSRHEGATARRIARELAALRPDHLFEGLGGHGVAAIFAGAEPGPTVMLRAELDALPIPEGVARPWASQVAGVAHLCGHDGHMAILMGAAHLLARLRPARGRAVVLFQPAEEDGSGAARVLADPRFAVLAPDVALALHNMPGAPLGQAWLRAGPVNCASLGLKITLTGSTAHAATPHTGRAPTGALAALIPVLTALSQGSAPGPGWRLATITHARLGEPAFGIAPGVAELWVTLRALADADLDQMRLQAEDLARAAAAAAKLDLQLEIHDHFTACSNHEAATELLARACATLGIKVTAGDLPMRASEDFGRFGAGAQSAMLFLGAGSNHPALHDESYDFPDSLIQPGAELLTCALRQVLGP